MHILILVSWYKTDDNEVAGTFFEEHARMLQKSGHKVSILYPECKRSIKSNFQQVNKQKNFDDKGIITQYVVYNALIPRSRILNYKLCAKKAYGQFKRYVDKYGKPDILHAQATFSAGIVAEYISKKTSIPFVLTEHYSGLIISEHKKYADNRKLLKSVFSNAAKVVFVSDFLKDEILNEYDLKSNKKYVVIPNVVNPIFYESFYTKKKSEPFTFLAIGHLDDNKNFLTLLKSFKLLINSGENTILSIVGTGPLRQQILDYIRANSLYEKVSLLGTLNRNEIKNLIDASHVLVSTSNFETFGMTIIESLASGRPVLATNSGGSKFILSIKDGLLTNNTVSSIYEDMKRIIINYNSYDQKQIRKSAIDNFGEKNILLQFNGVYKEILNCKVIKE